MDFYDPEIPGLLHKIAAELGKPFYLAPEFWAVVVALAIPFLVEYLRRRPYKSNLVVEDVIVINQDNNPEEIHERKLLDVARLAIKNSGKFKAQSVEAYVEAIKENGEVRKDFIPMPLSWTHGQLNKNGPTIRDVYPNQTVLLDVVENILDPDYAGEREVRFAVAAGQRVDTLSRLALGVSEILIKIYQESGQVSEVRLRVVWDGETIPAVRLA